MTTQFNWIVSQLECAPSENDLSNVIKIIHWRYQAQDGDLFADTYGCVGLGTADPNNFTEYSNITKDTVISWLESSLNAVEENEELSTLQKSLIQNIESQRNPPIVNLGLPWDKVEEVQEEPTPTEQTLEEKIADGYNPDARDGDDDGIIQEGTKWERPVNTEL